MHLNSPVTPSVFATMEPNNSWDLYTTPSYNNSMFNFPPNPLHTAAARAIVILCFIVTCLLGIFGNGLIVLVLIRRPKMHTVINLFIGNLAMSDLVLCGIGAPLTLVNMLCKQWPFGIAICGIYTMITGCMVFVSSLTFTAVAIDRFCLVVYPFLRPITKTTCIISIVIIWIASIGMTLPMGLQSTIFDLTIVLNDIEAHIICSEYWTVVENRKKYAIAVFVVQFAYPLLLVTMAHTSIAIKLTRNTKPGARRRENDVQENRRRRRTNRMLSSVVAVFAVCWLPLNIVALIQEFGGKSGNVNVIIGIGVYFLAASSTWMNPMLYAWLNENFRKEFNRLMPCLPCLRESRNVACVKVGNPGASTTNFLHDKRPQSSMATYLQPSAIEKSSSGKSGEHDTSM